MSWEQLLAVVGLLFGQSCLLWYKMGKVETALKNHCRMDHQRKEV